jgi:hypothetical protein
MEPQAMAVVEFEEGTLSIAQRSSDVGSVSSPGSFGLGCAKERSRFSASVEWMRTRDAIG